MEQNMTIFRILVTVGAVMMVGVTVWVFVTQGFTFDAVWTMLSAWVGYVGIAMSPTSDREFFSKKMKKLCTEKLPQDDSGLRYKGYGISALAFALFIVLLNIMMWTEEMGDVWAGLLGVLTLLSAVAAAATAIVTEVKLSKKR